MTTVILLPPRAPGWTTGARSAAAALLLLHAWLAWSFRVPGLSSPGDDATYLSLARALRSWSYAELWTAGAPAHAMYPPAYPALLSLFGVIAPTQIQLGVVLSILLSVTALALVAVLAGRIAPWLAVAVLVVCAPNPTLADLAGRIYSEPLFMALSLATVLLLAAEAPTTRITVLAGAAALAASLTRSIGVVLVAVVIAHWVVGRRWRAASVLAGTAVITVGAWMLWTVQAPRRAAGSSYIADAMYVPAADVPSRPDTLNVPNAFPADGQTAAARPASASDDGAGESMGRISSAAGTLAARLRANTVGYLTRVFPAALAQPTVPGTPVDNMLGLMVLVVTGGLGFLPVARQQRITVAHLVSYLVVLLVWPYGSGRFLAPVLPLVVMVLLAGIWSAAGRWISSRSAWVGIWLVAGAFAFGGLRRDMARWDEVSLCDRQADPRYDPNCASPSQREFFAAVDTARQLAQEGRPLLTSKASTVYQLSGRASVPQDDALSRRDPDAFITALREQDVDIVILSRVHFAQWGMSPMLAARCREFELLASMGPHTKVLRLVPAAGQSRDAAAACEAIRSWASGDWVAEVDQARLGLW